MRIKDDPEALRHQSERFFAIALTVNGPNGDPPKEAILREVWDAVPRRVTAYSPGAIAAWFVACDEKPSPTGKPRKKHLRARVDSMLGLTWRGERVVAQMLGMSSDEYAEAPWVVARQAFQC